MRTAIAFALSLVCVPLSAASPTIQASEYAARRARVASAIGPSALLILRSAQPAVRNGDVDWPYRQEDNLFYLTGMAEPGTTLVLVPGAKNVAEVLFVRDSNPSAEVWTGKIPSFDEVKARSGVQTVVSNSRFEEFLGAVLLGGPWRADTSPRYFADPVAPEFTDVVRRGAAEIWLLIGRRGSLSGERPASVDFANKMRERFPEVAIRDVRTVLRDLRAVKSAGEVALLRRAIEATVEAQRVAMRRALTATNEKQIHAAIEQTFLEGGACCWGFPSIVAAGANATTLHYEANNAPIVRGDLLLTDIGADFEGYSADVTRTYPVSGKFTPEQRAIYEAVYRAQEAVFAIVKPGRFWRDLDAEMRRVLGDELLKLGLITKNNQDQVAMYVLHNIGHPIGLQVHDVGHNDRPLEPGIVLAIEPGVYVRKADVVRNRAYLNLTPDERKGIDAALARYAGIGVRIEDDLVVTSTGFELLSSGAPRKADAIERFMAGEQ